MIIKGEKRNYSNPTLASGAPTMLKFLALALLVCIVAGTVLFLYWYFSNLVSTHRRQMNAAAYSAQIYFDQREELLRSLKNSAIRPSDTSDFLSRYIGMKSDGVAVIPLPVPGYASNWTLFLTERDMQAISSAHIRLIHIFPHQGAKTTPIWPESSVDASGNLQQSKEIAQALINVEQESEQFLSQKMIWLAIPGKVNDRFYIFTLLDPNQPLAGWLGVELQDIGTGIDFSSIYGNSYVLLDQNANVVLHSMSERALSARFRPSFKEDAFGLYGNDLLPDYMALNKKVGEAGWSLVYYMPIDYLLRDGRTAIQLALGLCALFIAIVLLGMRRIRERLIIPSLNQYHALLDMASFSQTVIETAPIALCVLRRANGSVALANELTRSWLSNEVNWQAEVLANPYSEKDREMILHDGRHVYLTLAPTRYRGEDVVLCAFIDITAHKRIEESLLQAKINADEANTAKTLFLTTMSHELRTPLYGMLGALELFSLTTVTSQQKVYLHAMQQSSATLLRAVSDTLDISRIEAGQVELDMTPFSPLALLEEVAASYAAGAERKNLRVYYLPDPAIPDALIGDVIRIKQILNNLMSNALKFTQSGQVVIKSQLLSTADGMVTIVMQVNDTGYGIDSGSLDHIFEPFYQVEREDSLRSGTGLGLSICSRFAQMMGGAMSALSEPGIGSSFSLTLPLYINKNASPQKVPVLNTAKLCVHSDLPDLSGNIRAWLRAWGALAYRYDENQLQDDGETILLEIASRGDSNELLWNGPRIAARLSVSSIGTEPMDKPYPVIVYGVHAIAKAINSAQRRRDAIESVDTQPLGGELKLSILVVEDNPVNRMILKEQLSHLGCTVEFSDNGRDALNRSDLMEFDIVLTDVNMPFVDGYEFTTRLRKRGYLKPIFGITANAAPEDEQRCLAVGMNMVLTKPLSLAVLKAQLELVYS